MRIKPFRAVRPNLNFITSPDEFFGTVKEQYPEYRENGFFIKSSHESFYAYQIKTPIRTHTGLIACTDILDYIEGYIKKHENTLAAKEQKQMNLMIQRGAIVKPVLLTYPDVPSLQNQITQICTTTTPFFEVFFESQNEQHLFWEINDGQVIERIQYSFKQYVPKTYIADGHHRCSTTALMHHRIGNKTGEPDYGQLLCAFFPVSELEVHDYNRVVEGLNDISLTTYMAKLSQLFDIKILKKGRKPKKKHEIVMLLNKEWFALHWKKELLAQHHKKAALLDANLLNEHVLYEILGIEDVRTDLRVKYIEGPKGVSEIRKRTIKSEARIGFLLYPVQLTDMMKIADANQVMPPKSTWFEPRIKNGLVVQEW